MNVSKNGKLQGRSRSDQKYSFVHASAVPAKRSVHPALTKPLSDDSKGRDEMSFRIIREFGGELTDIALPAMRITDFLRGL